MKQIQSRKGNVIVITMFCLILVMFIAAMVLDVGLIGIGDEDSNELPNPDPVAVVANTNNKASESFHLNRPVTAKQNAGALVSTDDNLTDSKKVEANTDLSDSVTPNDVVIHPSDVDAATKDIDNPDDKNTRPTASSVDGSAVRQVLESLQSGTGLVSRQPRDFIFVVDLSGSMNDDTEPAWATQTLTDRFAGTELAGIGESLIQQFYTDLNFGSYPGKLQYIGAPLGGIPENSDAYHEMTRNGGKLTVANIADQYRIEESDDEETRKIKAYKWMIDNQISPLMPAAKPTPDSSVNYEFWEKYLDYVMVVKFIGRPENKPRQKRIRRDETGPTPGLGNHRSLPTTNYASIWANSQPLARLASTSVEDERGWIPPNVDSKRIYKFNNPNKAAFSKVDANSRWQLRNQIGYRTYTQFLLDWGRNGQPDATNYVQNSVLSPFCSFHDEDVNGETFAFPPRTQPMHGMRRSLITALQVMRDRNYEFGMTSQRDLVSILAFDNAEDGVTLVQSLTDDYEAAMNQCTSLQAAGDLGSSTATEVGLKAAYEYLKPISEGGVGRRSAEKVVVLFTDGRPTARTTTNEEIDKFVQSESGSQEFYRNGYFWMDAAVMQARIMSSDGWYIYPVGVGFGADFEFLDRVARIGSTAIDGEAMRPTGGPAEYESAIQLIFNEIIVNEPVSFTK